MAALGVSHLAIGVYDMEKTLPFYVEVLGFAITSDFIQDMPAGVGADLHKGRHIRRRQVWLRQSDDPHGLAIALDQLSAGDPDDRRADIYDIGIHHAGLWVDDITDIVERARAAGTEIIAPHTAPADAYGDSFGGRIASVFLRDPEGNLIQCDQRVRTGEAPNWDHGESSIVQQA